MEDLNFLSELINDINNNESVDDENYFMLLYIEGVPVYINGKIEYLTLFLECNISSIIPSVRIMYLTPEGEYKVLYKESDDKINKIFKYLSENVEVGKYNVEYIYERLCKSHIINNNYLDYTIVYMIFMYNVFVSMIYTIVKKTTDNINSGHYMKPVTFDFIGARSNIYTAYINSKEGESNLTKDEVDYLIKNNSPKEVEYLKTKHKLYKLYGHNLYVYSIYIKRVSIDYNNCIINDSVKNDDILKLFLANKSKGFWDNLISKNTLEKIETDAKSSLVDNSKTNNIVNNINGELHQIKAAYIEDKLNNYKDAYDKKKDLINAKVEVFINKLNKSKNRNNFTSLLITSRSHTVRSIAIDTLVLINSVLYNNDNNHFITELSKQNNLIKILFIVAENLDGYYSESVTSVLLNEVNQFINTIYNEYDISLLTPYERHIINSIKSSIKVFDVNTEILDSNYTSLY